MEMPFGKYKGEQLADIPTSYLEWMLENCSTMKQTLRNEVKLELDERETDAQAICMGDPYESFRS